MKRLLVLFKNVTPDVQNFPFFKNCLMTALLRQPLSSKGSTPLPNFNNFHNLVNQDPLILTQVYFKTIYYSATQWRVYNRLILNVNSILL